MQGEAVQASLLAFVTKECMEIEEFGWKEGKSKAEQNGIEIHAHLNLAGKALNLFTQISFFSSYVCTQTFRL